MLATTISDTRDAVLALGSVALAIITLLYLFATRRMADSTAKAAEAAADAARQAAASTAVSLELLEIERARRADEVERTTAEARAETARLAQARKADVHLSMTGPNHTDNYTLHARNEGEHVAQDVRLEVTAGVDSDTGGELPQNPSPFNLAPGTDTAINVTKLSGSGVVVLVSWTDGDGHRSERRSVMYPS